MFKLIEARIYDKSIQCRKQAFIEIAANSDYVLKILSLEDAVNLYQKLVANITDEKPSVRKEALVCIDKFTKIFHDKLKIGRDEEWQEVVAIN